MSTIISYNMAMGIRSISIYAPTCNTVISGTDITDYLITILGDTEMPFINAVRFAGCTIIADNMRAFNGCYFHSSCTMKVKDLPVVKGQSINDNFIEPKQKIKISQSVISDVKRAEKEQSNQCECVGGCIESDCHGQKNKSNLADGTHCKLKL